MRKALHIALGTFGAAGTPEVNLIPDGTFDAGAGEWQADVGWTVGSGKVTCAANDVQFVRPVAGLGLVNGQSYRMKYTITDFTSGSVIARIGNTFLTARSAAGTYEESGVYDGYTNLGFYSISLRGSIDNVELFANP